MAMMMMITMMMMIIFAVEGGVFTCYERRLLPQLITSTT
jgi:hypothetical protein